MISCLFWLKKTEIILKIVGNVPNKCQSYVLISQISQGKTEIWSQKSDRIRVFRTNRHPLKREKYTQNPPGDN